MNRKSMSGKIMKVGAGRPSSASRASSPGELPILPEMPAFFPDPISLDTEDKYLKVLRNEIYQQEYKKSRRALHHMLQEQIQKQKEEKEKQRGESVASTSRASSIESSGDTEGHLRKRTSGIWSPPSALALTVAPATTQKNCIKVENISKLNNNNNNNNEKKKSNKKIMEGIDPNLTLSQAAGISSLSYVTPPPPPADNGETDQLVEERDGISRKGNSINKIRNSSVENNQLRKEPIPFSFPEIPIYLSKPMPSALINLVEEVGITNATSETRIHAMAITEAQQQQQEYQQWQQVINSNNNKNNNNNQLELPLENGGSSNIPITVNNSVTIPQVNTPLTPTSPRYISTFPLADAFVLEAEQRLAAEIFCETICKDIVQSAAEMYVSRCFDALANAYTAFSVWDEVQNSVIRSFIPNDPCEPPNQESEIADALSISQKRRKYSEENNKNAFSTSQLSISNPILKVTSAVLKGNKHYSYLGLLPVWSPSPSLLDADSILSFHNQSTETSRPFTCNNKIYNDKINKKLISKTLIERKHSSTFSKLLAAPIKNYENPQQRKEEKEIIINIVKDGENPGIPPSSIPLDDYARYVVPKISDLQQNIDEEKEEEKEAATADEIAKRKVNKNSLNRRSRTSVPNQSLSNRKENDMERRSITPEGLTSGVRVNEESRPTSQQSKEKKHRPRPTSGGAITGTTGTGEITRPTTSGLISCDDELTKALRQLPRGYLTANENNNSLNNSKTNITETLVLIDGEQAVTLTTTIKRKKEKSAGSGSKASKRSMSHHTISSLTTQEGKKIDDNTTKLQVSILNGGRTAFNTIPINSSTDEDINKETNQQQNHQLLEIEPQTSTRKSGYSILSRKKQKILEERRRRQKEAAEKAEYESMFFSITAPAAKSSTVGVFSGDEENLENIKEQEHELEPQPPATIIPEPGVIVERWPETPSGKNTKPTNTNTHKSRARRGKGLQNIISQTEEDPVLADGGEWILPEGKYRWAGFNPNVEEKNSHTRGSVVKASDRVMPGIVVRRQPNSAGKSSPQKIQQEQEEKAAADVGTDKKDGEQSGGINNNNNNNNNKDSRISAKPPTKPHVKSDVRPLRRAPPTVISARSNEKNIKGNFLGNNTVSQSSQAATATAAAVVVKEINRSAVERSPHGGKNLLMRVTLPRLPVHLPKDEEEILRNEKKSTTPRTYEKNQIRLLASILQSGDKNEKNIM